MNTITIGSWDSKTSEYAHIQCIKILTYCTITTTHGQTYTQKYAENAVREEKGESNYSK